MELILTFIDPFKQRMKKKGSSVKFDYDLLLKLFMKASSRKGVLVSDVQC